MVRGGRLSSNKWAREKAGGSCNRCIFLGKNAAGVFVYVTPKAEIRANGDWDLRRRLWSRDRSRRANGERRPAAAVCRFQGAAVTVNPRGGGGVDDTQGFLTDVSSEQDAMMFSKKGFHLMSSTLPW